MIYKYIRKVMPQLKEATYTHDNNYQRAGVPVVLQPNEGYYKQFPNQTNNVF